MEKKLTKPKEGHINHYAAALIVARPSRIRDGLRALLKAVPEIGGVFQANDGPSALNIIVERQPALVLLDFKLANNDIQNIARQIRAESPQTRCIIIVDNNRQRWMAKVADVDSVLLRGFSAEELFTTIEELLPRPNIQEGKGNGNRSREGIQDDESSSRRVKCTTLH